ncbi:MAG TPA: type VII secretion-associated serine protease mycosin [Actinophytocola sp.]|jgi:membrane-anchored mycosin MYCP|nr:type VII secretion-associated serine protease mycosin [Actinophytocola sp.]
MAVTRTRRTATVLAVTFLLAAVPAAATAQPAGPSTPPSGGQDQGFAKPPPLPPNFPVPADGGKPDKAYTQKTQCVSSNGATTELRTIPWGQNMLRFRELSRFATGRRQTVAVIDTGVSPHDFLGNRLLGGGDYVVGKDNGLKDCDGHGTEVAGIIAANPKDNDIGFRGIAPGAKILSIRQSSANYKFDDPKDRANSVDSAGNLSTLAQAIRRAADSGVSVINMSVDSCRPTSAGGITEAEKQVQSALRYAVKVRDVVAVASAGNRGENNCSEQNSADPKNPTYIVTPPWFSDYVLSVAAMERNGDPAEFSIQGPWVSVAAPGTNIISLDPGNPRGLANRSISPEGQASPIQGTSFAAPYVTGLVALVRERFPDLTATQVMNRIKQTASHPAATGGHNSRVGYGMINPIGALTTMIPSEDGIASDEAVAAPFRMPPAQPRDWSPEQVAMIAAGGGVALLLLTLFIVHTVRRNRRAGELPR